MKKDLKGLRGVLNDNFESMDLRGIDFSGQNLSEANFKDADLEGAIFEGTVLVGTNFEGANLKNADFSCANAWSANFNCSKCKNTSFLSVNLTEASFEKANLNGTSFVFANLTEASLEDAQNIDLAEFDNTVGIFPVCPDTGSFTGWTLAEDSKGNDFLIKAMIPRQAKRSSGTTRKCRTNKLYIDKIFSICDEDVPKSFRLKNRDIKTAVGESLVDNNFEENRFKTSSVDLYFWVTSEEALAHARKKI
jgi:pentapeptide repeat protein|nr:MAG TPA: pentapeptide repeat protein [Caudoviricetes sp.]